MGENVLTTFLFSIMTPELDDLAYETAFVAYQANGLIAALQASYKIYREAGLTHDVALQEARQTVTIIQQDAAADQA